MSTTSHGDFKIAEVDGLEVLSLVDNSVDFFLNHLQERGSILQTMDDKAIWASMGKDEF